MKWIACELHTHTKNSDGQFTVEELMQRSKEEQLACIALTDHNTFSGHLDITEEMEKSYLPVAFGLEWTTYFGHMLVLGTDHYVDWRDATPDTIDEKMKQIKAAHGVIGVAHPFVLGDPMCTGCHWDFRVKDWSLPDYMEIWSEEMPSTKRSNQKAVDFWTSLLNQGFHLAATHGRDWHSYQPEHIDAVTYVGIDGAEPTGDLVIEGIRSGRTFVTMGPKLSFVVSQKGHSFEIGDTAAPGQSEIQVSVTCEERNQVWGKHGIRPVSGRIVANGETIATFDPSAPCSLPISLKAGWIRAEIDGIVGKTDCPIVVSSPIYVQNEEIEQK